MDAHHWFLLELAVKKMTGFKVDLCPFSPIKMSSQTKNKSSSFDLNRPLEGKFFSREQRVLKGHQGCQKSLTEFKRGARKN